MKGLNRNMCLVGVMLLTLLGTVFAANVNFPAPPDNITLESSTRRANNTLKTINAEAGNVTELTFKDYRRTTSWQGYYGNITGQITLDNGDNYTMFDWQIPTPTGEIYAANDSNIQWSLIHCVNFSNNGTVGYTFNASILDKKYGMNNTAIDRFDQTFNNTYYYTPGFLVGNIRITGPCPLLYTYVNDAPQTSDFQEVLLTDNSTILFTAILNNSIDGFKAGSGDRYDFQMLVGENGNIGHEATTTTYWFYVELT
ncbi:MAG: hypothetical protein ABIC04_02580 [Nanoarchaeota archaeon]